MSTTYTSYNLTFFRKGYFSQCCEKNSLKALFHCGRRVIWFLHPLSYLDIERIVLK